MAKTTAVALTGADTIQVGDRVLTAFADADNGVLEFPNELAGVKTGKNGNTVIAFNAMGLQGKLTLRILRASQDDQFLNDVIWDYKNDPTAFDPLTGYVVKRVGTRGGNVRGDIYNCSNGVPTKQVAVKSNVEGDTEQGVSIYEFTFGHVDRAIQ